VKQDVPSPPRRLRGLGDRLALRYLLDAAGRTDRYSALVAAPDPDVTKHVIL